LQPPQSIYPMEKEIVVALMGAGRAGREHAANLVAFPDVRVDQRFRGEEARDALGRHARRGPPTGPGEFRRVLKEECLSKQAGRQAETNE
jgi:hypothetical protein